MDIILSNSSGEPIYEQIADQVREQILSGALSAGDALPSMRVLAKELRISVITTKRAYEELERERFSAPLCPGKGLRLWPRRTGSCCGRPSLAPGGGASSPRPWMRPARAASPCRNCRNF
ncbi:MAG: GntR family transcriptional regulator [Lawsonibacter sp.]